MRAICYIGKELRSVSRINRFACVLLSAVILCFTVFSGSFAVLGAVTATRGYVDATNVNIRADATTSSVSYGQVSNVYVTGNGEKKGTDGYTWYNITYGSITGYIRGDFVVLISDETDKDFESQIAAFPESYRQYLRDLHAIYPNWKFYADNISMTLDEAVALEIGRKVSDTTDLSWRSMDLGSYNWNTGEWASSDGKGKWYYVSREVIRYYMDPRNFLNANNIYTYMQLNYDPSRQTEEGLKKVVAGTFLERGYSDPYDTAYGGSYIKVIMAAAESSGVSPYVLAATIIQEQGVNGTSPLISGEYSGYEGYYNFFNIGATDGNAVIGGLTRAKNEGWNTRSASIIGGAQFCGNNYVSAGQNTYFYMNYNIKDPDRIWHEYAGAVHNAASSGSLVAKTYKDLKTAEIDFLIPVYEDMPSTVSELPAKTGSLNNYYFNSITVSGLTPTFSRFTYDYDLKVSGNTTVKVIMPSGASYAGADSYALSAGRNIVRLKVRSQTGYTTDYVIDVLADRECVLYVDSGDGVIEEPEEPDNPPTDPDDPATTVMCGDTNGDGKVSLVDLVNVEKHILGIIVLSEDGFKAGDTNGDGKITLIDLANIQKLILNSDNIPMESAAASTIIFGSSAPKVGDTVEVTVNVNADEAMYALDFVITYDPAVLQFISGNESATGGAGTVRVVHIVTGSKRSSYTIRFKAIASGASIIQVKDGVYVSDSEKSFTGAAAVLTVSDYTASEEPGDVNGDGNVDITDLISLKKQIAGGGADAGVCDINNDGEVSSLDLAQLRIYLLNG